MGTVKTKKIIIIIEFEPSSQGTLQCVRFKTLHVHTHTHRLCVKFFDKNRQKKTEECKYTGPTTHNFTWFHYQCVVMRSDVLFPESSCAHIATFIGLLRVLDDDALLQADSVLETRGQCCAGACFQVQVFQTWISCQAGHGSIFSLTSKNVIHQ